ncbi:aldo/keto reductase [Streptomyces sp. RS2]|uniref:aldo/keto reductase n=1 Tax=Streptomyces sp. RS2 TaxID=1451205 RepID=UPI0021F88028|nr:aldo/keto reductase [Streptomyces sp. RS2]MCW1100266.1 aldo/keto reductase [Streptomyces sp. RS2]
MTGALPHVPLGRSTAWTTPLAFGGAGVGNLFRAIDDEAAAAVLECAWDQGIRAFDTAPHYGLGLSERRLGAALRTRPRDAYMLSTKVGRILERAPGPHGDDLANGFAVQATHRRRWDFSADGVRRSLEDSLGRLGLDHVDIVYLHDPDNHARQALDEAYPALEQLRAEGLVKAIGVGMNQSALPARFVRDTDIDIVLLAGRYTLLDQSAQSDLLPQALHRGVSVVAGGVFNSGLLAHPCPDATYDYEVAPAYLLSQALHLQKACGRHGVPLRAAAARFPLGHPAVAGVLLGLSSIEQVLDAVTQFHSHIPEAMWQELAAAGHLDTHDQHAPTEGE